MPSPLPLRTYASSGLKFPWAFEGKFNLRLGHDGVEWSEVMQINWGDLQEAIVALLGYSWRDTSNRAGSVLRRKLPWQHPYFNQLFVKNVTEVSGIGPRGTDQIDPDDDFDTGGGGVGLGTPLNQGPWSEFERARINVQFWRPPYFVRSDQDIVNRFGIQQEWLRYVDKTWLESVQILSREGSQFVWSGGAPGGTTPNGLPGTVGQAVTHQRVSRTWYEVPEAALFQPGQDAAPNGQALNLMYSQTAVVNPITGYPYPPGYPLGGSLNVPIGGSYYGGTGTIKAGSNVIVMATIGATPTVGDSIWGQGIPTAAVIVKITGMSLTLSKVATASGLINTTSVSDAIAPYRLFGAYMGTLRFDFAEVHYRSLQLPPYLMQIPLFSANEAISQQQCDVVLHFDLFDPPRGGTYLPRGHNNLPWAGNGLWYPANSRNDDSGGTVGPFLTAHPYADLTDLFRIL